MFFHNKASTGRATLPITVAYVAIAGLLSGAMHTRLLFTVAGILLAGWLMEALNVRNMLNRSHLTSCLFMLLSIANIRLLSSPGGTVAQILFIAFLLLLFRAYQDCRAPAVFFCAHLFIGIISLLFIQIFFLVPFLWIMTAAKLQAASTKNFMASLAGILLPYWFWLAYVLYTRQPDALIGHFVEIASFEPVFKGITEPRLLAATAILAVMNVCEAIRFFRFDYNESLKIRMLHFVLIATSILSLVFLILQPQHKDCLLRIVIICTAAPAAHYFTFVKSRTACCLFILLLLAIATATISDIWMP